MCFFFFKQKTAYEMRISDWSSDVCSSDLAGDRLLDDALRALRRRDRGVGRRANDTCDRRRDIQRQMARERAGRDRRCGRGRHLGRLCGGRLYCAALWLALGLLRRRHSGGDHRDHLRADGARRSEEHTSELQSLMRISYAVFCLKKKKIYTQL